MTEAEWSKEFARCLGAWLYGEALPETDARGRPLHDSSYLVLFNAHHEEIPFKLPESVATWHIEVDTSHESGMPPSDAATVQGTYPLRGRSLALLREVRAGEK
jgi:glycogen operon protein